MSDNDIDAIGVVNRQMHSPNEKRRNSLGGLRFDIFLLAFPVLRRRWQAVALPALPRAQVHFDRRRETQHPGCSKAARTARRVASSTPWRMRSFRPSPSTNSMPASVPSDSSLTRAKLAAFLWPPSLAVVLAGRPALSL